MELGETWSEFRKNHPKGNKEKIMSPSKIILIGLGCWGESLLRKKNMQVYPETQRVQRMLPR